MNRWLAVYEWLGVVVLLASVIVLLELYAVANQAGAATGHYVASVDTNAHGANTLDLVLIVLSAPACLLVIVHHAWNTLTSP